MTAVRKGAGRALRAALSCLLLAAPAGAWAQAHCAPEFLNPQNAWPHDPVAHVVIVHTGNSPDAEFDGNAHLFPLRDAIVKSLAVAPVTGR